MIRTIIKTAIVASAITVVAACGSGSGSFTTIGAPSKPKAVTNFNNPDVLAADVASTIDAKQTDGSTVDVTCIHVQGTQFTCIGVWSDDSPNSTATVTVAADGQSWISS